MVKEARETARHVLQQRYSWGGIALCIPVPESNSPSTSPSLHRHCIARPFSVCLNSRSFFIPPAKPLSNSLPRFTTRFLPPRCNLFLTIWLSLLSFNFSLQIILLNTRELLLPFGSRSLLDDQRLPRNSPIPSPPLCSGPHCQIHVSGGFNR